MKRLPAWLKTTLLAIVGVALLALVLAWLSGALIRKTAPGQARRALAAEWTTGQVVEAKVVTVPRVVKAVGSVRAVHETAVGSRLLAKVSKVHVTAGQSVTAGDVLVELDKSDIEARLRGASANVEAAVARFNQARSDLEKVTSLRDRGAATAREFDDATRAAEVAAADLTARRHALEEVQAQLSYAIVTAPITGTIIDKLVEEGDLAQPGQTLVTLYDPGRLQLVASVPERVAVSLRVGQQVNVELDAIAQTCPGTISEIVPQSSAASRAMTVKVVGACPPGVVSGMFGRLLIQEGQRDKLLIPAGAVRSVGQLDMVQVVSESGYEKRLVRVGQRAGAEVEILSGLTPGEKVLAP